MIKHQLVIFHYNAFDTISTRALFLNLKKEAEGQSLMANIDPEKLLSHNHQVKALLAASMLHKTGVALDIEKITQNRIQLSERLTVLDKILKEKYAYEAGTGKEARFNAVMEKLEKEHSIKFPRFEHKLGKTLITSQKDKLQDFKHIEFVRLYLERETANKFLKTFIGGLEGKTRVHPRYDILKATGRYSCFKPNLLSPDLP